MQDLKLPDDFQLLTRLIGQGEATTLEDTPAAAPPDWTALVNTALAQGVLGQLCHKLQNTQSPTVPPEIRDAASVYLARAATENRQALDDLKTIITGLQARGIEVIPFKGPLLALDLYADIALRGFRDLDFLIREEQVDAALEHLVANGYEESVPAQTRTQLAHYRRYSGQAILFGPTLPLEPHWALVPSTLAIDIDYCALWDRSFDKEFDDWRVRWLPPEDQLLLLCLHGGKEAWTRLKWVADVAQFLSQHPELDWPALLDRARRRGTLRMTLLGLLVANRLLHAPLPADVQRMIEKEPQLPGLLNQVCKRILSANPSEDMVYTLTSYHWQVRERRQDRWRYLLRTLLTPRNRHFALIRLPDALYCLYYPLKLPYDYLLKPIWRLFQRT